MNWQISSLDRTLPDGWVFTAHWRVSKTEGTASGSVYGTISFPAKPPSDPDFIPYEDLTEAQVVQWVKDAMGANQVAAYEAAVQGQIDAQINPTQASGTPWSSAPQTA
jgi:hypothetical protein